MKKFTLFILLIILCGSIALSAQSEITRRSDFFDNIAYAITMDNGDIVVLDQRSYYDYPVIYFMNEDLEITDFYELPYIYKVYGMAAGTDNSIFVVGRLGGCDYDFGERELMKISFGSGLPWVRMFDSSGYNDFFTEFGNVLKTGPDGGVWFNEGGSWSQSWVLYDNQGNIVNNPAYPFDWTAHVTTLSSGDLLELSSYTVRLYDDQFNLLNSKSFASDFLSNLGGSYAKATADDEYIYIVTATNPKKLLKLDYDLQLIDQRDWNIGDDVKAMTTDGNGNITIIGNEYHHIYATEIDSSFNFVHENTDVGIVEILNANVTTSEDWPGGYWVTYGTVYEVRNAEIVVQNFGTEPISSFEINAFYHSGCVIYCGEDVYLTYKWLYNDLLLPGERDTLYIGDMNICLNWDYDYGEPFCFYTTRPNGIVDKNQDNDEACSTFETFLPIELLTPLKAEIENRTTILTWETATETNNEGFEIQKSRDGINWEKIAWVDGRGDALTPHTYTYTDENLLSGISYYRFKQLDFDGKSSYSNIVNVQHNFSNINIHPNPVKNTLHITNTDAYTIQHINIFDQTGKQVISTKTTDNFIDVSDLSTGVYIIEIHIEGGVLHEKILVE